MSSQKIDTSPSVIVYGRDWCEDTLETCQQLDSLGVAYRYVDIDLDPAAAAWVDRQGGGKRRTPTLDINGKVFIEPDERTLEDSLRQAARTG